MSHIVNVNDHVHSIDFLDVTEKSVKISKHHKNFTSIRNESTTEKPKEIVTTTETELNKEVSTTKHSSSSSKTIDVKDKTVVNPLDIDEKEKATSGKSHATTEKSAVDKKQKDGVPLDVVTTTPSPKKEKNKGSEKKNDDDTSKNQTIQWFLGKII